MAVLGDGVVFAARNAALELDVLAGNLDRRAGAEVVVDDLLDVVKDIRAAPRLQRAVGFARNVNVQRHIRTHHRQNVVARHGALVHHKVTRLAQQRFRLCGGEGKIKMMEMGSSASLHKRTFSWTRLEVVRPWNLQRRYW